MTVLTRSFALGLVALLTACGAEPAREELPAPLPVTQQVTSGMAEVVKAADGFGLDLLTAPALASEPNLVLSPASVSTALQMAGEGAKGETAAQIRKVLRLPGDGPLVPPVAGHEDLKVSNTAWIQRGLGIKPGYRDAVRDRFGAATSDEDFVADPGGARDRINRTVADQTEGRIPDLFPETAITGDTRLVLANALYLKVPWAREFPRDRTVDAPFTRSDGSTVSVPMMRTEPEVMLGYAEGPGYQAVTLPYRGGRLAFTVIVPGALEALRGKGIAALLGEIRPATVELAMPRFTVRSGLDLSAVLKEAGMPAAFGPTADFSGITDEAQLRIASVQHKTFVQVDEEGTEAAAATGVEARAVSAELPRIVTVDRPFLFVITDTATGAPLFLGRIGDPAA
ncbi:serpin family protein [Amycolatopsis sp. WAC 04182]|uniref:serpin family protein n=1 Tax=Amycolatopsis sp. WAC 04182 TaxID=2203198 RepID=UPI00131588DE|nr:serpin family protein [Amycolatopsis sp. WAC 04182]